VGSLLVRVERRSVRGDDKVLKIRGWKVYTNGVCSETYQAGWLLKKSQICFFRGKNKTGKEDGASG